MKKPISWNQAILIACIVIVLIILSKNYEGTMSIYGEEKRIVTYEEFKTYVLEGDGICSPGERRGSVDCKTELNFDTIIGCIWKEDVQCSSKFTTGIIIGIVILVGYIMIGGKIGKKREK